jgi:amyloid beta (A4) precursor protein-binding family B protein 2 (Fe65-like)
MCVVCADRLCGYIVDVTNKTYVTHAFLCEPSAGMLCKTIEAACKVQHSLVLSNSYFLGVP